VGIEPEPTRAARRQFEGRAAADLADAYFTRIAEMLHFVSATGHRQGAQQQGQGDSACPLHGALLFRPSNKARCQRRRRRFLGNAAGKENSAVFSKEECATLYPSRDLSAI